MYTTSEIAKRFNVTVRTVQKACAVLGIKKMGRDYLLEKDDVDKLRIVIKGTVGRPKV